MNLEVAMLQLVLLESLHGDLPSPLPLDHPKSLQTMLQSFSVLFLFVLQFIHIVSVGNERIRLTSREYIRGYLQCLPPFLEVQLRKFPVRVCFQILCH